MKWSFILLTIIYSIFYISPIAFGFSYSIWRYFVEFLSEFKYLFISLLSFVILLFIFLIYYRLKKKELKKYIILYLLNIFILTAIVAFPYILIFGGTKIRILLMVFSFLPFMSFMSFLIFKEFNKKKILSA